jgi:hypothetical protein
MKKVFTFAISLGIMGAVAAQPNYSNNDYNKYGKNSRYESSRQDDRRWNGKDNNAAYRQNDRYDSRRMSDRERQVEMDRINKDYDRRIAVYRNNRRMAARERDYQIQVLEKERSSKLKAFGGGLLLGGIIGAILSH